jgi:hypothetical protein
MPIVTCPAYKRMYIVGSETPTHDCCPHCKRPARPLSTQDAVQSLRDREQKAPSPEPAPDEPQR